MPNIPVSTESIAGTELLEQSLVLGISQCVKSIVFTKLQSILEADRQDFNNCKLFRWKHS